MPHAAPETFLPQFGLTAFRPGQRDVIETVLSGRDCLCVMPTGGGKSLCYQLPALMIDGLTLVVSPLIALMKDQVDALKRRGLPVTFINSTLPPAEQYARLEDMAAGTFRLVYVVPERFRSQKFLESVRAVGVKLLAVDEAHCISEWGHDFRPDYARLGYFRRLLGHPTTIALTATATDQVRRDIVELLDLREPATFMKGFARPNLLYEVGCTRSERQKNELLLDFLGETPGSGIIYTSTRKKAEEVAAMVKKQARRKTAVYHAGLPTDVRKATQEAFMDGRYEIVAATNAFGMGIDKADVRFVIHYNIPGSIEAYYQEAGRAGRDGKPSRCLMFYLPADERIQEFFIENAYPSRETVRAVYEFLCGIEVNPIEMTQQEVKEKLHLSIGGEGVGNCEHLLEGAGVLERLLASQNRAAVRIDSDLPTLVDMLPKQAKVRRRVLQAVERLVGTRRQELVYFQYRDLGLDADMDQTSLTNALRELNELRSFSYVPPFRGRAIRMIRTDLRFHELDIDFKVLEERKAAEYEKLARVVNFALATVCRQADILRYFGEADPADCDHCDNCARRHPRKVRPNFEGEDAASARRVSERRGGDDDEYRHEEYDEFEGQSYHDDEPEVAQRVKRPATSSASAKPAVAPSENENLTKTVRIILSGVARTQARFACGKTLIAQMLRGSKNKNITKLKFNGLSTYGLLKDLKEAEIVALIDALVEARCLNQTEPRAFRPVIELTDFGSEVMRGTAPLTQPLKIPSELLRKLTSRARAAGGGSVARQPIVGGNSVADQASATELPPTKQSATESRPAKPIMESPLPIGEGIRLPQQSATELPPTKPSATESPPTKPQATASPPPEATHADPWAAVAPQPPYYWTWRLLSAGFSAAECSTVRAAPPSMILQHAAQAAEKGLKVDPAWLLGPELLESLERLAANGRPAQITDWLPHLPPGTRPEEVSFYLKCKGKGLGS